jgi:cell division inhibitor SepF
VAAIIDGFKKFANYVVEGIGGEGPFDVLSGDEDGYEDGYEYGYGYEEGNAVTKPEPIYTTPVEKPETKVVGHERFNRGGNDIITIEPRSFDDAATIVQHIKDRKIVMLNLHLLDKEQSQRTIDFVCGASHALNGNQKKVGDVFVFAPSNVTLSADVQPQQSKFNDSMWSATLQ